MQPNGLFLLTIGLCSFAVVAVVAVYMALKAWKLTKRGIRLSRIAAPLVADITRKSDRLARLSYDVGLKSDEIAVNLEKLDASLHRLQVLFKAFDASLSPYRKIKTYLGL